MTAWVLLLASISAHAAALPRRAPLPPYQPGVVLVKYKREAAFSAKSAVESGLGATRSGELPAIGWTVLTLPTGMPVEAALARLRSDPSVAAAEPDRLYRPLRMPNDPSFPAQYGLSRIDAPGGWEFETGASSTVTVAVIDTGIDGTQPDLSAKTAPLSALHMQFAMGTGAGTPDPGPTDLCGHGSQVAGVAAASANNGLMIAGVSWGARLLSLGVFETSCASTDDFAISSAVIYGVSVATSNPTAIGRMVMNLSLGECPTMSDPTSCGPCTPVLVDAMDLALANNIPVVAASGNLEPSFNPYGRVECPGKIPGVIAAGATDETDTIAYFSGSGPEVWVTAPGVSILTTQRNFDGGGLTTNSGTSFSSPHVAGLIALMLSAKPATLMAGTTVQGSVGDILKNSADDLGSPGFDPSYGWGRINAFKALRLLERGTLADFQGEQKAIAFPNPAKGGKVSFSVPTAVAGPNMTIRIYTIAGQFVKELSGLTWDGTNNAGASVAAGVYIFLVKSDKGQATGRVAVLH